MAFFLPQGPPPALNASVQYRYHTPDGGPPNQGKPPAPPSGPPPQYSQFPFYGGGPPPAPGFSWSPPPSAPPGPFGFCAPQPPAPAPSSYYCHTVPPAPPGGAPTMVCWPDKPSEPLKPAVLTFSAPPALPSRAAVVAGSSRTPHPPDPGNRINNRIVKADDGTGVLCSEEMTTFHVLNPGRWFDDNITISSLQKPRDFMVQHVDSDWSVQRFIKRLGGLEQPRLSAAQVGASNSLICVEEWHEKGNGRFERGSNVFHSDAKAHMSLKAVGWGPEHGKAGQKPPVWIMLYPINGDLINK